MVGLADGDLKGVFGSVSGGTVLAGDKGFVFENFPLDAVPKVCRPPTQSDHFIVGIPIAEGIVGCMHKNKAAPTMDIADERLLGFLSPLPPVVVENDSLMLTLKRIPVFPCGLI
jgi:hypothetical protein